MEKNKNGFLEIPFAWLFSIVVGVVILFLAIFLTVRVTQTQETRLDATTAKEIGILLNPLETSFETAKTTSLILPKESRIYNRCTNDGYFGRQILRLSQQSFNKWTDTGIDIGFSNKYIFSENFTEGKKFLIFSKTFSMPFKVSDVVYLTSSEKKYCFIDAPMEISEELKNLNQENIIVGNDCPADSARICFNTDFNCEANINMASKYVDKSGKRMYFNDDTLMHAAIFSEPELYECQFKRLMMRWEQLSLIYGEKEGIISKDGCSSTIRTDLIVLGSRIGGIRNSFDLNPELIEDINNLKNKKEIANCK